MVTSERVPHLAHQSRVCARSEAIHGCDGGEPKQDTASGGGLGRVQEGVPRSGIYAITHTQSGRRYIGSAVNIVERWWQHKTDLNRSAHHNDYLSKCWRKYGEEAFTFDVLEAVSDKSQLISREQFWIDSDNPAFNACRIAGSPLGIKRSAKTRAKLSALGMGRKHTPETLAKKSAAMRGRKPSKQTIAAGIAANLGCKKSPQTIEKISEALRTIMSAPSRRAAVSAQFRTLWADPAYREKMMAIRRQRMNDPAVSEKMSRSRLGKKASPEARAKMSASHKARYARLRAERQSP